MEGPHTKQLREGWRATIPLKSILQLFDIRGGGSWAGSVSGFKREGESRAGSTGSTWAALQSRVELFLQLLFHP